MVGPVLVLDDDADVLQAAKLALAREAEKVDVSEGVPDIGALVGPGSHEVVLLDMNFGLGDQSGAEGLDQLARAQAADPTLSVVLMTAFGGVSLAVEALKRGAADFVLKPWRNEKLLAAVEAAAELTRTRRREAGAFDLEAVERSAIARALHHHGGNVSHAAKALGLTRPALYRRMEKHGL
jgi:DNA-binding NtrC family response regulator